MIIQLQILLIALFVSVACALPGVFLVLRGVALMSDAISHAVLPGIVLMFLLVGNLDSPLLLVGAAIAGMATVLLTELIIKTKRLKEDAALGIVFPLFFSFGVLLISLFARNVHLDIDMVILGELAFAPFNRFILSGVDLGPAALWTMGILVIANSLFTYILYKELQVATFDPRYAYVAGLSPALVYYILMIMTSITTVGAFDCVGSIVVVALMITPAATAYLLVSSLQQMISYTLVLSMLATILGYLVASVLDVSIAGSIATMSGIIFLCALCASPTKGLRARYFRQRVVMNGIEIKILEAYLKQHTDEVLSTENIARDLGWSLEYTQKQMNALENK